MSLFWHLTLKQKSHTSANWSLQAKLIARSHGTSVLSSQVMSAYGSITIFSHAEGYKTNNKGHIDTSYAQEKMAAALISTVFQPGPKAHENWISQHAVSIFMSEILLVLLVASKWWCVPCSDQFKLENSASRQNLVLSHSMPLSFVFYVSGFVSGFALL